MPGAEVTPRLPPPLPAAGECRLDSVEGLLVNDRLHVLGLADDLALVHDPAAVELAQQDLANGDLAERRAQCSGETPLGPAARDLGQRHVLLRPLVGIDDRLALPAPDRLGHQWSPLLLA